MQTLPSLLTAVVLFLSSSWAFSAPPDLTATGVISGIDTKETYNLGPTGLRGWIHVNRNGVGDDGLMTDESRQILVAVVSSPADAVLEVDDVILGAMAGSTGDVPLFSSDCRKAFGAAIGEAEKTGAGTLRIKRWRAGQTSDVNISLPILGNYSDTAPYNCPKSAAILTATKNKMVADLLANPSFLVSDYASAVSGLALLASVTPKDPNYKEVQARLQSYARQVANEGPQRVSIPIWDWSYIALFLSEYYLITGDAEVIPGIKNFTLALAQSQSIYGTYGHSPSAFKPDGSGSRICIGYGPVNAVGLAANLGMLMGKKALIAAKQNVDPEIDLAIERGSKFFGWFANKGSIPYGEHEPSATNHASNGKDSTAAVFFGLQSNRGAETEYFSRVSISSFVGREYGHTGQGLSFLWNPLGAAMGGPLAAAEHIKPIRWHLDLSRRTDGSFAYDGQEQYGPGTTADGTYLGGSDYSGLSATAYQLLTFSLPLKQLFITGKNANPAYVLDPSKVANAITAGTFKLDRTKLGIAQLTAALNEYDPVVRHYAAVELGSRQLSDAELTTLRNLLTSKNSNERQGACQALGLLQDAKALPMIVQGLSDPDLWVRAKAANAIRSYDPVSSSAHVTEMLTAFIKNATDPNVIDWIDPIQISNRNLSLALFGNGVPDGSPGNDVGAFLMKAPKDLVYRAIQIGLKQPDSYPRTGVARFCKLNLSLEDVQALIPDMYEVVSTECQADRMWSASPRALGIQMLSNYKISEGVSLAYAMLEYPEDFGWGAEEYQDAALQALATYGDAARYTLPKLRALRATWDPSSSIYATLLKTIDSIENASVSPKKNLGLPLANAQVIVTTEEKAIKLGGESPRGEVSFVNITQPSSGKLNGTAPNLTFTPATGFKGVTKFSFQVKDAVTVSDPAFVTIIVGTGGNGLKAEYFKDASFSSPVLSRTDPEVNFDWGKGTPDEFIKSEQFSVRWSGLLLVPETGDYTFSALNSDGIRVYVNGALVLDRFMDQAPVWTDSAPIHLKARQVADIQIDYYKKTGSGVAKLKWSGPSFTGPNGAIISKEWLHDGKGIDNRPAYANSQSVSTVLNKPVPITISGSGGNLKYSLTKPPANGKLSGVVPHLIYTPTPNFSGLDHFDFSVSNGKTKSEPAKVTINVKAGEPMAYAWNNANSGNWSDTSSWSPSAPTAAGASNFVIRFDSPGSYNVSHDLSNGFKLNQLHFGGGVTLGGSVGIAFHANGGLLPQIIQNGSEEVTLRIPSVLTAMTELGGDGSGKMIFDPSCALTGDGGLIKNAPGVLEIRSASNSYKGGTIIKKGILRLDDDIKDALGTGPVTMDGGTLYLNRVTLANSFTLNSGAILSDNGFGNNLIGAVTVNSQTTLNVVYKLTISGEITGAGGITKTGDSELLLSGKNSFTGSNKITAGTLTCSSTSALGESSLDIATGAKINLDFSGIQDLKALTYNGGAKLPAGTYGSSTSSAKNKNDDYFSGTGQVRVTGK
ncbi:MAG: DUF6288 domain-containing protein [Verrucomicrobiota bacterium]